MNEPLSAIAAVILTLGVSVGLAAILARVILALVILLFAWGANFVAKRFLLALIHRFTEKSKTTWDDALREKKVFVRVSHLAPAIVIYCSAYLIFPDEPSLQELVQRLALSYIILAVALVIGALLGAVVFICKNYEISRHHPIKAYTQVLAIVVYLVATILVIATLLDKSPWGLLSGLGALTAVLMLVFRDSILGFVASIQLVANDMVRVGDWIEMPKYGADGDVLDISLTTIKVQNFDKTVTTIPTYAVISDAFKNWRGMSEAGGRRIKRSIAINMHSIRFCDDEMITRFEQSEVLKDYISKKRAEIKEYNSKHGFDDAVILNGRRMTNVGCFRAYIEEYLKNNSNLHPDFTFLVRQLAPTEHGLPIEIYVFTNDTRWVRYEEIQADIFDHILAAASFFDLEVFQEPSGADFRRLAVVSN